MSAFRKIGPAIGSISTAVSPAGGAGVQLGDVRLFPPGVDPGAGWLRGGDPIAFSEKLKPFLVSLPPRFPTVVNYPFSNTVRDFAVGAGVIVAVGVGGQVASSADGVSWVARSYPHTGQIFSVVFANGVFVAVGDGGQIATSPDGIVWSGRAYPFATPIYAVAFGNGVFVAIGGSGQVATSPDGIAWTARSYPHSGTGAAVEAMTFGNGLFVAGGFGPNTVSNAARIATSPDGITWTSRNYPATAVPRAIHFANGIFVFVGNSGVVVTSNNGVDWTNRSSGVTATLLAVDYGFGFFIAVGTSGNIIHSRDGAVWSSALGSAGTVTLYAVLAAAPSSTQLLLGREGSSPLLRGEVFLAGFSLDRPVDKENWTPYTRIAA